MDKPYFKVRTTLGVEVRTTATYWGEIVTFKHPVMRGKEDSVKAALANPLEVRKIRPCTFTTELIRLIIYVWS